MILIKVLGAFFGIVSICFTYGVERKFVVHCGLCGASGWLVYLLCQQFSLSEAVRTYFAALVVSMLANTFARARKAPVTVFLTPGILPLVPGLKLYRSVHSIILANNSIAGQYLLGTMKSAGCIALAIFTMDSIYRMIYRYIYYKRYCRDLCESKNKASNEPTQSG